jgi:aminomethyltransferase
MEKAKPEMLRTPLYEAHKKAGARLVPFAGWEMPVQYAGVLPECRAVREGVGLFDVSHMGRIRVHGEAAVPFLQYLTVNDVSQLSPEGGQAQYSLFCRDAGGIIDDIIVYRLGRNEFIVVVNASNREKDLAWMRHHAVGQGELVLEDETGQTALIAVQGPRAIALVDALSDREVASLPRFGLDETVVAGVQTLAARTGYTGEDGVELFCRAEEARALWQNLVDKGGAPCGLGARDTLRLEAALPLYGHEMDEHTHPYEARLGWVVRTQKHGDFVGKNALSQLKDAAKRKRLVGLEMEGRAIPRDGYPVHAPEGGGPVGVVTSGTFSPMRGKGIALARVDAAHAATGTRVEVLIRDARHGARVVPLPFYKNV